MKSEEVALIAEDAGIGLLISEEALAGVKEAAVAGIPDARKGEQPIVFIVSDDGATIDQWSLRRYVRSKIADYKVPRRVHFLSSLPRTASGEVVKAAKRDGTLAS